MLGVGRGILILMMCANVFKLLIILNSEFWNAMWKNTCTAASLVLCRKQKPADLLSSSIPWYLCKKGFMTGLELWIMGNKKGLTLGGSFSLVSQRFSSLCAESHCRRPPQHTPALQLQGLQTRHRQDKQVKDYTVFFSSQIVVNMQLNQENCL